MNIFACTDYKRYIAFKIESAQEPRGVLSRLAQAAGCQRSYLSQVLHSHIQLTPDHAYGLAEHWQMSEAEADCFLLLVEKARAGSARYARRIDEKLKKLRKDHEDLANRFHAAPVEGDDRLMRYYSAWYYSAIHVAVSIPEFQLPSEIAKALNLPLTLVQTVLQEMETMNYVRRKGARWFMGEVDPHLRRGSLLNSINHNNWRQRAMLDSQSQEHDGVNYTAVFSMSESDFELVKEKLLKFIDDSRTIIGKSTEERLIGFTCDYWKIIGRRG